MDPYTRRERSKDIEGAGVTQPDAIPDIRADGSFWSGGRGVIKLRDSSDFIDLSSVTNRTSRYKEYERLRSVAEIETAVTVFSDESCVAGDTLIATPFGYTSIKELAETKQPEENFLVYCYDFSQNDYTLGWAYHPRLVKRALTVRVFLDDGTDFVCTHDHRVLLHKEEWLEAGSLKVGMELMPFYRLRADHHWSKQRKNQFPRVYSRKDGWKQERMLMDEWRSNKKPPEHSKLYKINRMIASGLNTRQVAQLMGLAWPTIDEFMGSRGFSYKEVQQLAKRFPDRRRVIHIIENGEQDVYDMSVDTHENFATNTTIFHNCQLGEHGHMFDITVKNGDVKEELEFLFFHPKMLNMDRRLWNIAKNLFLFGDHFLELIIDPEDPKSGILKTQTLPADSVYRIETIKGKLLEFQQSKEGPDYQSLARVEVTKATAADLAQATAIRFVPESIVHFKVGDERRTFYPYGVSLIEAARGPAHQLRLMEDAMLVYRLTRAPERRVFYIDVGQLPPFKAESFIQRLQDQFRKKKTFNTKGTQQSPGGAGPVEERWVAPSQDEDFWIPLRPNAATRVETLPGAQNLGEIDDALYFRNKLFIALNFPKNYMAQEDTQITRVTLSSVDVKFARLVERLQQSLADGLTEIALRHLELRGFPPEMYEDLQLKLTAPSHWREISENEVIEARFNRALAIKGSQLFADLDILIRVLKVPQDEAKEIVSRATIQKLQELKLQVMAQNPQLMGIAMPGQGGPEMGTQAGGPSPMLTGTEGAPGGMPPGAAPGATPPPAPGGAPPPAGANPPTQPAPTNQQAPRGALDTYGQAPKAQIKPLPEPTEEEINMYDLDITDYSKGIDDEEIDTSELEDY